MYILGNFLTATAYILNLILTIFYWLILIRAILSWVNPDPFNPIVQFLYRSTEPLLYPVRRFLPPMGLDISPLIVFLIIIFLRKFLVVTIMDLGLRLG